MAANSILPFIDSAHIPIITSEFGSVETLYAEGLQLVSNEYSIQRSNSSSKQVDLAAARHRILDLKDKLDALGVDGHGIMTAISSDFGDILLAPIVGDLRG